MSHADFVIPAPIQPTVPVSTGGHFPVRRIFCVGRNYAEHSKEMGADPTREAPFFFMKPADALIPADADGQAQFPYPASSQDVQHEIELVVALSRGGSNIALANAADCIYGYALGLDMTQRDLQSIAKIKGRPWYTAKGFDASAPISHILPMPGKVLTQGALRLTVNGTTRQTGNINQMIWSIPEIIHTLSQSFALKPGDLIFTGTPAGVAAVQKGDLIQAHIDMLAPLNLTVI